MVINPSQKLGRVVPLCSCKSWQTKKFCNRPNLKKWLESGRAVTVQVLLFRQQQGGYDSLRAELPPYRYVVPSRTPIQATRGAK